MPLQSDKVRLFVAAYPPPQTVVELLGLLQPVALPPHQVASDMHLTVHFIGPVERRELPRIRETLERAASGLAAFEVTPIRLIGLPERSPRLVAVELDLPYELAELQRRLAHRFSRKTSGRAYVPHVTLARWRSGGPEKIGPAPVEADSFAVREICLMSSVLKPSGAEHHLLGRVVLSIGTERTG